MGARLLIIVLLMTALTTLVPGQQAVVHDDSPARQEAAKLTPEEEQEALDLAARFSERLRATNDFGQIIDEMFVPHFPERLRQAPQNSLPLILLDKSLRGRATSDELRRYYAASMNFSELCFR